MVNPQFLSPPIYETNIPNGPANGWYRPMSQPIQPETPPQSSQLSILSGEDEPETHIHDYWRRLLAPLPGKSTPPNLLQVTAPVSKAIAILAPSTNHKQSLQKANGALPETFLSEHDPTNTPGPSVASNNSDQVHSIISILPNLLLTS
jgi:hypothetical protein